MALKIGELYALITADDGPFDRALGKAAKKLTTFGGVVQAVGKVTALATLAASAVSLVDALAPAAGAVLALPAAMGVAAAAAVTLKVGLGGVSDAMKAAGGDSKKFNAALKGLAPNARRFVQAWAGLKSAMKPVQQAVQQRLFAGLAGDLRRLASGELPAVRRGMTATAGSLNALGRAALKAAATPMFRGAVRQVFTATRISLDAFRGAVGPLVTGLARLVALGAPVVTAFARWAAGGLRSGGAWLSSARGAATLSRWLRNSIGVLAAMGRIAGNLGRALVGVFRAASPGSGRLLKTVTQLTAKFAAWTNSAAGQSQLKGLFATLGQVAQDLAKILPQVSGALSTVLGTIGRMPGPVKGAVTQMLAWSIVVGPLATKFGPLVGGIGAVVRTVPSLIGAFRAVAVGIRVLTLAMAANPWLLLIAAIVILVVLVVTHWSTVKRVTIEVWQAIWGFVSRIVMAVVGFIRDHWRLLVAIVGGPLGLAVALVTRYWGKIWSFVQAAVRGVLAAALWLARLPAQVGGYFLAMAGRAIAGARRMLSYVAGIPGRIRSTFANAGAWLVNAGRNIINGLIRGIDSMVGWLRSKLSSVTSLIPSWKGPMAVDLRLLRPSGRAIMTGLTAGITDQLPGLHRTLAGVTDSIGAGVPAAPDGAVRWGAYGGGRRQCRAARLGRVRAGAAAAGGHP